jgi:ribokinase
MSERGPNVAVVGHVEWVRFGRVQRVPRAGEVVHGEASFEEPAGGGAVAAVQLARLAGRSTLVTALGEDDLAERSLERLHELGVDVWAARRPGPTRTAFALIDDSHERTITTFGPRLHARRDDISINWPDLAEMDAIYFTAGDLGALKAARRSQRLLATSRAGEALGKGVPLDGLIYSGKDDLERRSAEAAGADAEALIRTSGAAGGSYTLRSGESGGWHSAPLPGEPIDSYGCGDSFAGALTYGLAAQLPLDDALVLAARCGASCLTGAGPYSRQLTAAEI